MVNRVWNLWCSLSGTDPDHAQKMAFNLDRRVASLSAHAADLVELTAVRLWRDRPDTALTEFLDLWVAAVTAATQREEEEAQRRRRLLAEAEERKRQAENAERRRRAAEDERQRRAQEEIRRRHDDEVERQRRAGEARELQRDRNRGADARTRIRHLYNITSLRNIESIAAHGILCHDRAVSIAHDDISDPGVQGRRDDLHQFASLYFNPRNAMVSRLAHVRTSRGCRPAGLRCDS